jgi:4-amino-4-deoxy-L-arabinose transferase-like glycosyltransferase
MPSTTLSGPRLALGAGLLAYGAFLFVLIGAVPGGSDNSGYFNEARLLSQGRIHVPMRELAGIPAGDNPYLYVPLGMKPAAGRADWLVPTYPPGLPLLLVPASWVIGWDHAGDLVLLVHSLAGLALTFALGRMCGLTGTWPLVGAAILAASPLYLITSLQALSDVPATVWAAAAVVSALRSRERPGWALAAGACISVGFLVRPSNFLVAAPVLLAVGLSSWRLLLVALGAVPGVATWMAINQAAYGNALESGYGAIGNEFHGGLVSGTSLFYVRWLPLLLSPVAAVAPLILLYVRSIPRVALVLFSWILAFLGFYSAYRWTHEQWWFLRFVLPAAPAFIVAGLVVLCRWFDSMKGTHAATWRHVLPCLVLGVAAMVELGQKGPFGEARTIGHGERKYGRVAAWINAHVPKESALVVSQASGALFYFTDYTLLRFDNMNPSVSQAVRASLRSHRQPLYAVLWPMEQAVLGRLPGTWVKTGSIDDVTVWRCDWGG